jgi:hypothetical protein
MLIAPLYGQGENLYGIHIMLGYNGFQLLHKMKLISL